MFWFGRLYSRCGNRRFTQQLGSLFRQPIRRYQHLLVFALDSNNCCEDEAKKEAAAREACKDACKDIAATKAREEAEARAKKKRVPPAYYTCAKPECPKPPCPCPEPCEREHLIFIMVGLLITTIVFAVLWVRGQE